MFFNKKHEHFIEYQLQRSHLKLVATREEIVFKIFLIPILVNNYHASQKHENILQVDFNKLQVDFPKHFKY